MERIAPTVSIIIPAYNGASYLGEAVESALGQADVRCEVIVVDDGSTDDTLQVLEPFKDHICYRRQENQGQSSARNHGMRLSTADYLVFLDSDDFLPEGIIVQAVERLEEVPELGLVHGGTCLVDKNRIPLRDVEPWREAPELDLEACLRHQPVQLGAFTVRRSWMERVGGFDETLQRAPDVDLLLRLALVGCPMGWLYRRALYYRLHEGNITRDAVEQADGLEIVLNRFFSRTDIPAHVRKLEHSVRFYSIVWSAWRMYSTGQVEHITQCLQRSWPHSPFTPVQTVLEWMQQFAQEQQAEGRDQDFEVWIPHFQAASADILPDNLSGEAFNWWLKVWVHYVEEDGLGGQALQEFPPLVISRLLELAKECLVFTRGVDPLQMVDAFWKDALAQERVLPSQRHEVTALYLTVFGQASLVRKWATARAALFRAIRSSSHPRAAAAWWQFSRAALAHTFAGSIGTSKKNKGIVDVV